MIEKHLKKAVLTVWMAERLPGGASLILKGGWVLDVRGFKLLCGGYLYAIIATIKVGNIGIGWDCNTDIKWLLTILVHLQMPSLDGFQAMEGLMEIIGVALEGGKIIHES